MRTKRKRKDELCALSDTYTTSSIEGMECITKESGIRELFRYISTGRSSAMHGTSSELAQIIKQQGLVPRASKGIVDSLIQRGQDPTQGQNLAFLTRSRASAKAYAAQQAYLQHIINSGLAERATPKFLEVIQRLQGTPETARKQGLLTALTQLAQSARTNLGPLMPELKSGVRAIQEAPKKGVLDIRYPASTIKTVKNPELNVVRERAEAIGHPLASRILKTHGYASFINTMGVPAQFPGKVAVPSKYIKGGKGYQFTTPEELVTHARNVWNHPKETALEAFRNLSGLQVGMGT